MWMVLTMPMTGQVVLDLDGVSETFEPSWISFINDNLLFGGL